MGTLHAHVGSGVCCVEMRECADEIARIYKSMYNESPAAADGMRPQEFFFPPFLSWYSGGYTHISADQMSKLKFLTENPEWADGDHEKVSQYYKFHEECQLDQNLGFIASTFGVIVHGDIDQIQLSAHLKRFDIHKLMKSGPFENECLSIAAQRLIYDGLNGMPRVYDVHLHNLGYDEGSYVNPKIASQKLAPWSDYFTFMALRYASGMRHPIGSTNEARKRMHLYAGNFPKLSGCVLPIHGVIKKGGKYDLENTGSYLRNKSTLLTAVSFDNRDSELIPASSIHPFDVKWKEKLKAAYENGIRLIKWMPPQGISPDSELLDAYYLTMASYGMTLIAHAGHQHALPTNNENKIWEDCGNPLRFRRPLKLGVNVILAHCGHKDLLPDLDDPQLQQVTGYELFFRLAREAHQKNKTGEWKGLLYGDLAAVTTHYGTEFIKALLVICREEGIRLVYGSDYPYTNLIRPNNDAYDETSKAGLLDPTLVAPLKEIRAWNPLLANYIFTRNLEWKNAEDEGIRFPDATFTGEFPDAPLKVIERIDWQFFKNYPLDL